MNLTRRLSESHRAAKQRRAFDRALRIAPTPASRQELLTLLNR